MIPVNFAIYCDQLTIERVMQLGLDLPIKPNPILATLNQREWAQILAGLNPAEN
jgi:hypothetical protein